LHESFCHLFDWQLSGRKWQFDHILKGFALPIFRQGTYYYNGTSTLPPTNMNPFNQHLKRAKLFFTLFQYKTKKKNNKMHLGKKLIIFFVQLLTPEFFKTKKRSLKNILWDGANS
jgi:hypothetical protein